MITYDQAAELVAQVARPLGKEMVPLAEGHHRVLAEPVIAQVDAPPSDVSAMDGYAVREEDLHELPSRLHVAGSSFAGSGTGGILAPGKTVRIFTGAPMPDGADRVVIQEVVRREGDEAVIDVHPGPARHIRTRGSDFRAGDRLLEAGTVLGYRQLVACAGADLSKLSVWRRPSVLVIGTGDELAPPGSARETPGKIPESLSFGIAALASDWGADVGKRLRLADELPAMQAAAADALEEADLVVVTGGASVGEKDFAKTMFEAEGLEILFSKVAIKPGKPVWLGRARGKFVLGLPGNPSSALVTARLFLAPLLAGLSGRSPGSALQWRRQSLLSPLPACGERETFLRAHSVQDGVEPESNQDSGAQSVLAAADLLIRRRAGAPPAETGAAAWVLDF